MKKNALNIGLCLLVGSAALIGCKKKDTDPVVETPATYTIPTTYNFPNIDTTEAKQHIAMLGELTTYIRTTHSNTVAPVLDAQKLKDMYANIGGYFSTSALNGALSLRSQADVAFSTFLDGNFESAAIASVNAGTDPTATTASNGVSGKMINGTRYILVDTAGLEYKEVAEKGIMSSVFFNQAATILNNIGTYDNSTKTNGTTAQERAWDRAFAYFGVPVDFPQVTTGVKNWGSYCNSVSNSLAGNTNNEATSLNAQIMQAWITGRAAISNNDQATVLASATTVLKKWEIVIAGRFITYTKGALANLAAPATYHHNLSEAVGFIGAFKYNSSKTISDADIAILMGYFQTGGSVNLYNVTTTNLNNAIGKVAFLFNLDASKL